MPDQNHLKILKKGVEAWNQWRAENSEVMPDLCWADLFRADLSRANLSGADLTGADLPEAELYKADLTGADLTRVDLNFAYLVEANFTGANLSQAFLFAANLTKADLSGADLTGADLTQASLVDTTVRGAKFVGCHLYGVSVWSLNGEPEKQNSLIITRDFEPHNEPTIVVDNLEVAQFIYVLINHKKIRDLLKTITSKVVLILGRFTPERKAVLDALAEALRTYRNKNGEAPYLPVLFDFNPDTGRDLLETAEVLAGISRFIIADITAPKAVFAELQAVVPRWKVPVQLILDVSTEEKPAALLAQLAEYPWLVRPEPDQPVVGYSSTQQLCASIERLIAPIELVFTELEKAKAKDTLGVKLLE